MITKTASLNTKSNLVLTTSPNLISNLKKQHNITFGDMTSNHDIFEFAENIEKYQDILEILQINKNIIILKGKIHNYPTNLNFYKSKEQPEIIKIRGSFDDEEVNLTADFSSKKEPEFTGNIGYNNIKIKLNQPIFAKNSLKGKINEEKTQIKFPSESIEDKYPKITALLLNIAGFNTKIIDDKYTGLDTTNTRYKYFSGDYDKNNEKITFFDKLWKDPLYPPSL